MSPFFLAAFDASPARDHLLATIAVGLMVAVFMVKLIQFLFRKRKPHE